jgi:Fe-S-cluster containining protein
VTFLEAAVIEEYLIDNDVECRPGAEHFCFFLTDGLCTIYPVRPIICRTHGMISYNPEESVLSRSCMLNFKDTDLSHFDKNHALNTLKVPENLTRLNLLYCMLSEESGLEEGRISLTDLAGKVALKNK